MRLWLPYPGILCCSACDGGLRLTSGEGHGVPHEVDLDLSLLVTGSYWLNPSKLASVRKRRCPVLGARRPGARKGLRVQRIQTRGKTSLCGSNMPQLPHM